MSLLVEYGDCPRCWEETKTARKVGLDPDQGICCEAGHVYDAVPSFTAPKTEVAAELPESENVHRLEAETVPEAAVVQESDLAAASVPQAVEEVPVAPLDGRAFLREEEGETAEDRSQKFFANCPSDISLYGVRVAEAVRLPSRDLLFGLLIPEGIADALQAYAEEQKRPLAEILNSEVINILRQEWWR